MHLVIWVQENLISSFNGDKVTGQKSTTDCPYSTESTTYGEVGCGDCGFCNPEEKKDSF